MPCGLLEERILLLVDIIAIFPADGVETAMSIGLAKTGALPLPTAGARRCSTTRALAVPLEPIRSFDRSAMFGSLFGNRP